MNLRRKFTIYAFGLLAFSTLFYFLFQSFLSKVVPDISSLKNGMGMFSLSPTPVFQSGVFSDDGQNFIYTYQPEVEMPDVKGSVTIRGYSYPAFLQIINTANGNTKSAPIYETAKGDQLYIVGAQGDEVWIMESVYHEGTRLALYDLKAGKFRFEFGSLEKLNPSELKGETRLFYVNNTAQPGLIFEGNDKRYYRIDPTTGKATVAKGKFELYDYNRPTEFQVSDRNDTYRTETINGERMSIAGKGGKPISEDDFIEVKYLTLSKNKTAGAYSNDIPLTYYQNNFFVLSPVTVEDNKDMELAMLDKNTLKTVWKILLPQKQLKTIIPKYDSERFFIKGNQMLVTNNDNLLTLDLSNGKILSTHSLYPEN